MKITTKVGGIKVIVEMNEPEALMVSALLSQSGNPFGVYNYSNGVYDKGNSQLESARNLSRDINNAISKARNEIK